MDDRFDKTSAEHQVTSTGEEIPPEYLDKAISFLAKYIVDRVVNHAGELAPSETATYLSALVDVRLNLWGLPDISESTLRRSALTREP